MFHHHVPMALPSSAPTSLASSDWHGKFPWRRHNQLDFSNKSLTQTERYHDGSRRNLPRAELNRAATRAGMVHTTRNLQASWNAGSAPSDKIDTQEAKEKVTGTQEDTEPTS
eukprot:6473649-Amphidinium_carterae.1